MRIRSVASEAFLGLRRNLVMSIAAVVTVAVSLALVGTGAVGVGSNDAVADAEPFTVSAAATHQAM